MTNTEIIENLKQAQALLSDVYHWADELDHPIANLMSCADDCILEAIQSVMEHDQYDGPDEAQEWHDFDPEC